jgi:hypothetical protein
VLYVIEVLVQGIAGPKMEKKNMTVFSLLIVVVIFALSLLAREMVHGLVHSYAWHQ